MFRKQQTGARQNGQVQTRQNRITHSPRSTAFCVRVRVWGFHPAPRVSLTLQRAFRYFICLYASFHVYAEFQTFPHRSCEIRFPCFWIFSPFQIMALVFNGPEPKSLLCSFVKGSMNADKIRATRTAKEAQRGGATPQRNADGFPPLATCGTARELRVCHHNSVYSNSMDVMKHSECTSASLAIMKGNALFTCDARGGWFMPIADRGKRT